MLAAAAKLLQLCLTLCDPKRAAHQAPPSLGFSRQEHWSGFPLPSPMHESEKWKWSCSVVSDPQQPHGLQPAGPLHPWDVPGKSTAVGWLMSASKLLFDFWQNPCLKKFPFMDSLKLKHSSFLGLGDWKEGNRGHSGHYGSSNAYIRTLS